MNAFRRTRAGIGLVALWVVLTSPGLRAADDAKPAREGVKPGQAEVGRVTGDNVYVRSGFHQNYYPVTKLNTGDEVLILGSEFGWLKIVPPAGTHGLIEKGYVDRQAGDVGVVNETAQVYAGSNLNDRRYAKQVKLTKGSRVQVLGTTEDGAFYRIAPSRGAALWISGDFVKPTGRKVAAASAGPAGRSPSNRQAQAASPSAPELETVKPGELTLEADSSARVSTSAADEPATKANATSSGTQANEPAPVDLMDRNAYQLEINAIEAQIAAESTKPLNERVYEPLIAKLQPLAQQEEDPTTQLYASTRIKQLHDQMSLVAAVREMRELREKTIDSADAIAAQRASIRARSAKPMDDIVVRGMIRVSGLYDGSAQRPKRWRIVRPQGGRTLAYLELLPDSPIDPVQYYGKYVGIRASRQRMMEGTVAPVPIYTVQEIVVLDPAESKSSTGSRGQARMASPTARTIKAPATQPAGEPTPSARESKPQTAASPAPATAPAD